MGSHSYQTTVGELKEMLWRVVGNEEEDQYKRQAAQSWIDKLNEMDKLWEEASGIAEGWEAKGDLGMALLTRMRAGAMFDNMALIIRNSAIVMFSDYLEGRSIRETSDCG